MSLTNEEASQLLDDLINLGIETFNSYETEFISDMIDRKEFTENQLNKIEEMWEKYCA